MAAILINGIGGGGTNIAHEMAKKLKCLMVSVNTHDQPSRTGSVHRKDSCRQKMCKGHPAFTPVGCRSMADRNQDPKDYRPMTLKNLVNAVCVIVFLLWLFSQF